MPKSELSREEIRSRISDILNKHLMLQFRVHPPIRAATNSPLLKDLATPTDKAVEGGIRGFVEYLNVIYPEHYFKREANEYLSNLKETSLKGYELVHTCKPDKNGYAICCCCTYKPVKETSPEEVK